jgi:hypothetical protein
MFGQAPEVSVPFSLRLVGSAVYSIKRNLFSKNTVLWIQRERLRRHFGRGSKGFSDRSAARALSTSRLSFESTGATRMIGRILCSVSGIRNTECVSQPLRGNDSTP